MSISSSHHDLFRQPSAAEKLSFVRSLIETGDLHADVATALLKSIHSELAHPQERDHALYASYARTMASLQHQMPEVHQHVVTNWQASRTVDIQPEKAADEADLSEEPGGPERHEAEMEESEKLEAETSKEVEQTGSNETSEEGERMAMEAAETAAQMEHAESEDEPPVEAAE